MSQQQMLFNLSPPDTGRRDELVSLLKGRGWIKSKTLKEYGFSDRELRQIMQEDINGDILSFPGAPGYKLFSEATLDEILRTESLRSQANQMLIRYNRYQRKRHTYPVK